MSVSLVEFQKNNFFKHVPSNIVVRLVDSQALRSGHPYATCFVAHDRASSKHFFNRIIYRLHIPRMLLVSLRCITTLYWPARFPNSSTIKHVWDHLGWLTWQPTSFAKLESRLKELLDEMTQGTKGKCMHQ